MSDVTSPTSADRTVFRRGITLTVMTLLLPGSAQLVMGNVRVGRIAMRIWLALVALGAIVLMLAWGWRSGFFTIATNPRVLWLARMSLFAAAIGWVWLLMDAWRISRPLEMHRKHRLWMTGVNGTVTSSLAATLLFVAHLVGVQQAFISSVFAAEASSPPHAGRYNILLLGGDSGAGREGLGMRLDSLNVASVDADTGKTVLIGLPRNLENVPFPQGTVMNEQFPHGFTCDGCYLNGINTWANDHKQLFGNTPERGITATIQGVEGVTGLTINYFAVIDLRGFARFVDAMGGVTINVKEKTAVGGVGAPVTGWIPAGRRHLNGHDALWYARSRATNDDWSRMGRQKCVMSAMLQQLDPRQVLLHAQEVAKSGQAVLKTNIPSSDVGRFMDLALKAKAQQVATVSLVPPAIYTGNPDFGKARDMIAAAIAAAEGKIEPKPAILTATLQLPTLQSDTRSSNQATDLASSC